MNIEYFILGFHTCREAHYENINAKRIDVQFKCDLSNTHNLELVWLAYITVYIAKMCVHRSWYLVSRAQFVKGLN